jgi:hypothetical protein
MSSREMVIELVGKLPEDMPLEQIAREIELLAGIQIAREQARRKEGIPAEDARKLVDSWRLSRDAALLYTNLSCNL